MFPVLFCSVKSLLFPSIMSECFQYCSVLLVLLLVNWFTRCYFLLCFVNCLFVYFVLNCLLNSLLLPFHLHYLLFCSSLSCSAHCGIYSSNHNVLSLSVNCLLNAAVSGDI